MAVALLVGLFSLLGVIVGGLLNGLVSAGLDRVRDARRAMVIARLVQSDLLFIDATIQVELQEGTWKRLTGDSPPLSFESWTDGRAWLGAALDYADWALVEIAARQAIRVVVMAPTNPKPGQSISQAERANLQTFLPDLAKGVQTLQPLAHGEGVPSLRRAIL